MAPQALVPRLVIVFLLVIAGTSVPAISAPAQIRAQVEGSLAIRLLEGPSDRADDPRAQQYIVDHVAPGDRLERRFAIDNGLDGQTDVQLYAAAADVDESGFRFGDGRAENELTSWTSVAPGSVTVDAGGSAEGTISIAVPEDAEAGERYAVVWAELPPATSATGGPALVNRVGIRIYLSVGNGAEPPTSFRLETFQPVRLDGDQPAVAIDTCNTGRRAVDVEGTLELADGPGGTNAGPFPSGRAVTVDIDSCGVVTVPVPAEIPRGPWKAKVTLRSGRITESAEAPITFPAPGVTTAPAVRPERVTDTPGGRFLILLAILLLLLVLLALLLYLWWRRRRNDEDREDVVSADASAST